MSCKIKYKGKEYTEEDLMIVLSQDSSIVDAYRPQEQRGAIGQEQREDINKFQKKVDALKEGMDVEVILDENISTSRVLPKSDSRTKRAGKPVILINPNAIFETTAIHEFAHIFIDSFPDGLKNKRLQGALDELRGTALESEVRALYPDLSEEMFQKELLATAIGKKGAEIWDNKETAGWFESFKTWFFDYLNRVLGLEKSKVESLAKDVIAGRVNNDLVENLSNEIQEERLSDVIGEENIADIESAIDVKYKEMLSRVINLYSLYEPKSKIERKKERAKKRAGKKTDFENVSELREALEKYSDTEQVRGIAKFIQWSAKENDKIADRVDREMKDESLDANTIIRIKEFSAAFDILEDIKELIVSSGRGNEITEAQQKRFLKKVSKIIEVKDNYEKILLDVSKQHYARVMAFNDVQHQEKRKNDFRKVYQDTQPEGITEQEYVQQQFNKFREDIIEESYQKYLARAEKSINDISSGVGILASEKQMKSDEIQVASKLVDGKDLQTAKFAANEAGQMDKMNDEYQKDVSSSASQEKKYKGLYELTSNGRYFLAGEYLAEFIVERNKKQAESSDPDIFMEKYADNIIYTSKKYSLDGGKTKNPIIIRGSKEIKVGKVHTKYKIGKKEYTISTEEAIARSEYERWTRENTRRIKTEEGWRTVPTIGNKGTKDWRNSEYTNLTEDQKKHLDFLKDKIRYADELTLGTESLIKHGASQQFIELPKVRKTTMSRIAEGQSKGIIKDIFENMSKVQEDEFDTEATSKGSISDAIKVFADVSNKEKLRVPIPFRNNLDPKNQSLDLHSIVLMNLVQAKNYEQKREVENLLLVMTDVMNNRFVPQTQGVQNLRKIHASSEEGDERILLNPKDQMPNDAKKMYDLIENRVYNIKNKSAGEVAGMDINKLTSSWLRYSGMVSLVGNFANSIVNLNVGSFNNLLEAVGGEQFGLRDLSYANKQYWKDIKNVMNDWGSNVDTSRTNLFMNVLNVMGDKNYLDSNFEENNRVKTLLKANSLRPIAKAGEHMMQAQVMYAVMSSIRMTNEKGQYLDVNGNVVSTKKQAARINEVMEFDKKDDGSIILKMPKWAKANTFSGVATESQMLLDLRNVVKKKVIDLHGNYDSDIQSAAQRTFWGKLLFFLRKWIEPGYFRRWRGLQTFYKNKEDLREVDKYFSTDLKKHQEGYYVTALRFITRVLPKAVKDLNYEVIREYNAGLLPHEKANIRKILTELGMITLISLAYAALGGDDDDENLYLRYLLRRQYSEMTFFMIPAEAYKIASTPTASMGMAKRFIQLTGQAMSPTERYVQGKNKGELKLKIKTMKMLPIYAQTKKDLAESLRFLNNVN